MPGYSVGRIREEAAEKIIRRIREEVVEKIIRRICKEVAELDEYVIGNKKVVDTDKIFTAIEKEILNLKKVMFIIRMMCKKSPLSTDDEESVINELRELF